MGFQPILGETITVRFVTSGLDGAITDADSLPTCEVMEDGNDTPILTPTVVKLSGKTGLYRVAIILSTGNGFEVGKCYNILGLATISTKNAEANLESFILRGHSLDGVNVLTIDSGERSEIARVIKTDTGNNTTTGSLGQQSKDIYNTMLLYGGIEITGTIDASPTPTATAFHVTLDLPLSSAKISAGVVGQFCTIRAGGAQTEGNPIATCAINSLTSLSLTFASPDIFSVAPVSGNPISISE